MNTSQSCLLGIAITGCLTGDAIANLITDDFEVDTSGDYTIVEQGGPDASAAFAFDYIAAGIPLAPRSEAGDRGGLRMTANDTLGAANAITAFHDTQLVGISRYSLTVDVYMGVTGAAGTTEYAHVGVAGDGVTPNQWFGPAMGSGHFVAFNGDGDSSSDYRHFVEGVGTLGDGDASYLNGTNTVDASGDTYQALFPGTANPGSPTNIWTTLTIEIADGVITYSLDGATGMTAIIRDTAVAQDGFVSLGYADLFTSIASPFQAQFVIYDNLDVAATRDSVPLPPPLPLVLGAGLAIFGPRRRRRA